MSENRDLFIRIGAFEGLRGFLWELGADPGVIIAQSGLDERLWDNPDTRIPVDQFRSTLNLSAEMTGQPHFALLLSQRQSFEKFGAVGYLAKHSDTLRTAINEMKTYLRVHDSSSEIELTVEDGIALWSHRLRGQSRISTIQHALLGMGIGIKIIRTVISPNWTPDAVYFEHQKPQNLAIFNRIFRCPVYFEQPITALEFPESTLQQPLATSDPKLFRILQTFLRQADNEIGEDFVRTVRSAIYAMLEEGKPTLENVAKRLDLHRSQVQRRLKAEDTCYQALLQNVRYGLARKYLADTDLSLAMIAAILGFAEPAVFSRAFRRQAGMAPRAWRDEFRKAEGSTLKTEQIALD